MKIININEFENLIKNSDERMFFRFYADWCTYCRNSKQDADDVVSKYKKKNIFFVNIENENVWASDGNTTLALNVVPTQRVYENKKLVWEIEGVMTKYQLEKIISNL